MASTSKDHQASKVPTMDPWLKIALSISLSARGTDGMSELCVKE